MATAEYGLLNVEFGLLISGAAAFFIMLVVRTVIKGAKASEGNANEGVKEGLIDLLYDSKNYSSLTNFQFFAWTIVFLFSILWIYSIRIQGFVLTIPIQIPATALALMGINTGSAVASKGISNKKYTWSSARMTKEKWQMMLYENGSPSLARVQLFIWTLVGIFIYLWILATTLFSPFLFSNLDTIALNKLNIPDVDPTLVTLIGLSHTAYVGTKYYSGPLGELIRGRLRKKFLKTGATTTIKEAEEALESLRKEGYHAWFIVITDDKGKLNHVVNVQLIEAFRDQKLRDAAKDEEGKPRAQKNKLSEFIKEVDATPLSELVSFGRQSRIDLLDDKLFVKAAPDETLGQAQAKLDNPDNPVYLCIVVESDKPVGYITTSDVRQALLGIHREKE